MVRGGRVARGVVVGRVGAAAKGDNPFAGGSLTHGSEGSDASDGAHHAFGERDLLSDDDPLSPTWVRRCVPASSNYFMST